MNILYEVIHLIFAIPTSYHKYVEGAFHLVLRNSKVKRRNIFPDVQSFRSLYKLDTLEKFIPGTDRDFH